MQALPEEEQMEVGRRLGDALVRHGKKDDFPVAKGVGRVERVPVSHGGYISIVHPVSIYRKRKQPINVPHLSSR